MSRGKMHLAWSLAVDQAACGTGSDQPATTTNPRAVTCKLCLRDYVWKGVALGRAQAIRSLRIRVVRQAVARILERHRGELAALVVERYGELYPEEAEAMDALGGQPAAPAWGDVAVWVEVREDLIREATVVLEAAV